MKPDKNYMNSEQNKIHEILSAGHWQYSFDAVGKFILFDNNNEVIGVYWFDKFYWQKKLLFTDEHAETSRAFREVFGLTLKPKGISLAVGAVGMIGILPMVVLDRIEKWKNKKEI